MESRLPARLILRARVQQSFLAVYANASCSQYLIWTMSTITSKYRDSGLSQMTRVLMDGQWVQPESGGL